MIRALLKNSGNLCARLLSTAHEVELFEANDYPGGHTNTVRAEAFGHRYDIDTGFMVFNHHTYPNFTQMLGQLNVSAQDFDMSFSVRCEQSGMEYQGSSLNGLFAQRSNLFRPAFYRMLGDVLRFNRKSPELLDTDDDSLSIGEYLDRERYGFHEDGVNSALAVCRRFGVGLSEMGKELEAHRFGDEPHEPPSLGNHHQPSA